MKSNLHTTILFLFATSALLLSGNILNPQIRWDQILVQQWAGWSGTFFIYQLGGIIFEKKSFQAIREELRRDVLLTIFLVHYIFILPLGVWFLLPSYCFWVFFGILVLGVLYSFPFQFRGQQITLKKTFVLKNLFIGFSWGALVLVGAAQLYIPHSWSLFLFVSLQIFTGSILRDFHDLEKDRIGGFRTFPIVLGKDKTVKLLHLLNLSTLVLLLYFENHPFFSLVFISGTIYKMVLIQLASWKPKNILVTQILNIGFCYFIFLLILTRY